MYGETMGILSISYQTLNTSYIVGSNINLDGSHN